MASGPDSLAELKQRLRASWMAGDFGEIAKLNVREGEGFIQRMQSEARNKGPGRGLRHRKSIHSRRPRRRATSSASTSPPIFWSRPANAPAPKI